MPSGSVIPFPQTRSANFAGKNTESSGPTDVDFGIMSSAALQQALAAPGWTGRRALQMREVEGFVVIANPGEPLRTEPIPGDVVIRMVEGGAGHASVVASRGLIGEESLAGRGLRSAGGGSDGYVHITEQVPFAVRASDGLARGLTDSAGRLLEDLVLLRLATPPTVVTVTQPSAPPPAGPDALAVTESRAAFPTEDVGDSSPFAAQALDACWSQAQNLSRTLSAADNASRISRLKVNSESRVSVDLNPYSSLRRDQLDAVIRAGFSSYQMPQTLLALWAKEGSLRMTMSATPVPLATTADNARSLVRSNIYYVDLGSDYFVLTRYDAAAHDNVWDNSDAAAPNHETHFRSRVAGLVGPGLLSQDIGTAINAELTVSGGPPFTVTPSVKFYALSLLLMDALFTRMQRNSFPQLSLLSEPMNYMQWNIGTKRFGDFLESAELHRNEPAYRQPSGDQISLEQWALHTVPRATEWRQARMNAIRFMHYQESFRPIFALAMNLVKPGIEDLPSTRTIG